MARVRFMCTWVIGFHIDWFSGCGSDSCYGSIIVHVSGIHQCVRESILIMSYDLFEHYSTDITYTNPCSFTLALCAFVRPSGGSMVLSGISCFFLWFGTSESMMIFMLCLYNGLSISAWNSLDVVTTESFPTVRRWGGIIEKYILAYIVCCLWM